MTEIFVLEIRDLVIESLLPLVIVVLPLVGSLIIGLVGLKCAWLRNVV
jgi:hypothetical protein